MKSLLISAVLLLSLTTAVRAQHEYAPLVEKEITYNNWKYKNIRDGKEVNLRDYAKNKKLVMVVYFAAWCPNWKLQAPFAQKLYDKYRAAGFEVVGVSEYETVEKTRANLDELKITFPVVVESDSLKDREKTAHYEYRKATGDARKWGSPWSIFLIPANVEKQGDALLKRAFVVNGELIEAEVEAFVRQRLGLLATAEEKKMTTAAKSVEVCDPTEKKETNFKKP